MTGSVHFDDGRVRLLVGDAREVLAGMPDRSVDCIITSPPYYGLRDYGTGRWVGGDPGCRHSLGRGISQPQALNPQVGNPVAAHRGGDPRACRRCGARREDRQYGLEATPGEYVERLRAVFAEAARVITADGTAWLNLGDCYASAAGGAPTSGTAGGGGRFARPRAQDVLPAKNLLGMPWRVAFALQADGWILRSAVVWHKPNAMPESVRDRLACAHEYVLPLVRSPRYWFNLDAIREPLRHPHALHRGLVIGGGNKGRHGVVGASARRRGHGAYGAKYHADNPVWAGRPPGETLRPGRPHDSAHPKGRNPGDVWSIATRPLRAAHFAPFPIDLPARCIAAGCKPGGLVLDPFSGAGTTGLAAIHLGRRYVGIDLNPAFHDLAVDRLRREVSA